MLSRRGKYKDEQQKGSYWTTCKLSNSINYDTISDGVKITLYFKYGQRFIRDVEDS